MAGDREAQIDVLHAATTRLLQLARRGDGHMGLGPAQTSALSALSEKGTLSVRALADYEGVAHATMSRIVSALESAGAVTKATDARDRRCQVIELTAQGRRLHEAAHTRRRQLIAAAVSLLKPDSVADLAKALGLLAERLTGPQR